MLDISRLFDLDTWLQAVSQILNRNGVYANNEFNETETVDD